jgi:hypothetical protein
MTPMDFLLKFAVTPHKRSMLSPIARIARAICQWQRRRKGDWDVAKVLDRSFDQAVLKLILMKLVALPFVRSLKIG